MRKFSKSNFPDLSNLPELPHRKSNGRHLMRWIFLVGLAVAAFLWKRQSALAPALRDSAAKTDDPTESVEVWVSALEPDNKQASVAETSSNRSQDPKAESSVVTEHDDDSRTQTDSTGPATIEAGVDERGIFRPTRAETDAFGVVLTDNSPVGLEADTGWARVDGATECPEEYPIKGNASSRIYHLPGESSYEKTTPEFCFADEDDAKAAGFRPRAR